MKIEMWILTLITAIALAQAANGDDIAPHAHAPITVRSRPVIERVPLKVVDPVDVIVTEFGDTLIADKVGKVVFRVDSEHEVSIVGRDLAHLSRLADSRMLGTHVLTAQQGSGRVLRLTETGFQSDFLHLPFTPAGLAVDEVGNVWTSNSMAGKVFQYGSDGQRKLQVSLSETVRDLTMGVNGSVIVLLQSGKLVTVFPNETSVPSGFVSPDTTRLKFHPDGFVVGLASDDDGKAVLVKAAADKEDVQRFAGLIQGTSAIAFDKLGNMTLANPDLRAITRVTSHFEVPCPHCGTLVPMTFSQDAPASQQATRRSF